MKIELSILPVADMKAAIGSMVNEVVQRVENGEISPLILKTQLKALETAIKEIDEKTKDSQLKEFSKYSSKQIEAHGFKIEQAEVGIKYDYSRCGDGVWSRLNEEKETAVNALKEREQMLKFITKSLSVNDEETGEVYNVIPPVKTSTTSLKLTLLK